MIRLNKLMTEAVKESLRKEASYTGNVGIMELVQFYNVAGPNEKKMLERLMNSKQWKRAWELIQKVTGTNLKGSQFHEEIVMEAPERDPLEVQLRREEIRALRQIAYQIARVAGNLE